MDTERTSGIADLDFSELATVLEAESALKEQLRDRVRLLEAPVRSAQSALDAVHSARSDQIHETVQKTEAFFPQIQQQIAFLAELIPPWHFYKYNDMFGRTLQNAVYCVTFVGWLKDDRLTTKDQVIDLLKIDTLGKEKFQLPTEDYLHGLITLISELSRLAMNSVTAGSSSMPIRISRFCKDLSAGFSLLNLKNDSLRRRFDSIKYDLKSIESVVYDITLRGLVKPEDLEQAGNKRQRTDQPDS